MKALFVRFNASGSPFFFGKAIVIPDANYLTLLINRGDGLIVNHANQDKMKAAKVLKEFEVDFFVVEMIIALKARFELLQKLGNLYDEEEQRLLQHLKDAYKIFLIAD